MEAAAPGLPRVLAPGPPLGGYGAGRGAAPGAGPGSEQRARLLGEQDAEAALENQAVPGEAVVRGEAGGVRREGRGAGRGHLLRGQRGAVRPGASRGALPVPSRSPPGAPPVPSGCRRARPARCSRTAGTWRRRGEREEGEEEGGNGSGGGGACALCPQGLLGVVVSARLNPPSCISIGGDVTQRDVTRPGVTHPSEVTAVLPSHWPSPPRRGRAGGRPSGWPGPGGRGTCGMMSLRGRVPRRHDVTNDVTPRLPAVPGHRHCQAPLGPVGAAEGQGDVAGAGADGGGHPGPAPQR